MNNHLLEADSILLYFDQRRILADIYIKCETGKITGLLGLNGEGKSCLMNIISGNMDVSGKSVRIDGKVLNNANKHSNKLKYLPQFNFIPTQLSIKRVLKDFEISFDEFVNDFDEFSDNNGFSISELSGGQIRLLEVYCILKSKTQFVLLDEPFSHISPVHIEKISEIMIREKENKGILVTDHMYRNILALCDNIYVLRKGKTHLTKSIEDIEKLGYLNFC